MQRVDGSYLYNVGSQIHPIAEFEADITWNQAHIPMYVAQSALEPLITRTVFQLKTSVQVGITLLNILRDLNPYILNTENANKYNESMGPLNIFRVKNALSAFEAVLAAELALIPLYVVSPKGGLVLSDLIECGDVCFPNDLAQRVPEALADVREATKCIAFELPTAAGFHLHRANESVLRRYFVTVAPNLTPPKSRNMGDYIKRLADHSAGDPKVIAALQQLKDLHRNPLMHPEEGIQTVDEAISLLGAVRAAMTEMLKRIPPSGEVIVGSGPQTS